MISIPYPRISCLKTIPFTAAHTYIIPYNMAVPPPPWESKLLQMTPQNATIDWIPMGQVTRVPPLQSSVAEIIEPVIKTNFSVKTKGKFTFQCNYPCVNVIFFFTYQRLRDPRCLSNLASISSSTVDNTE